MHAPSPLCQLNVNKLITHIFLSMLLALASQSRADAKSQLPWSNPDSLAFADETPLPVLDAAALNQTLPRQGKRLANGEPFTILAIGDSVTATGPYPEILARYLRRATGNKNIAVARAAYPGKSVDASVRRSGRDIDARPCDLALIMFGLNDQGALTPVESYIEQTEWLINHLRARGADVILLEPTPHINILAQPGDKNPPPPEASIFRTLGFAGALRLLGTKTNTPVARTFDALWNVGAGASLVQTARNLRPYYPRHYNEIFSRLTKTGDGGDTIHPNAYGHQLLACAVYETIANTVSQTAPAPLEITGKTLWRQNEKGAYTLITRLAILNTTSLARSGTLAIYPFPQDDRHESLAYALRPGGGLEHDFTWPGVGAPGDLLAHPCVHVFAGPAPFLQIVDYANGRNHIRAIPAPFFPEVGFVRERIVVTNAIAAVRIKTPSGIREINVPIPEGSPVGRIPLSTTIATPQDQIPIAGELVYVRQAAAYSGETIVDGSLGEWPNANAANAWFPVGESVQARWTRGHADHRKTPAECDTTWAIKVGCDGIHLAFRARGDISKDSFAVYFDTRPPEHLGTAGPYSWVDGIIKPSGKIIIRPGDTFLNVSTGLKAAYKTDGGGITNGEIFIPYKTIGLAQWPDRGELGMSIVWTHWHESGPPTRLMWSENGHPWSSRWFGVVRRDPTAALPYIIRIL